jgi:hypothetical protein
MRDQWMDLEGFQPGANSFDVDHGMFVDRLKFLPGNTIEGNQTLIVRAIHGDNASTNVVTPLHIMGTEKSDITEEESGFFTMGLVAGGLSFMILLLLVGVGLLVIQLRDARAGLEFDQPPIEAEFEE